MTIKDKQKLFMCNNQLFLYMIAEYELFFFWPTADQSHSDKLDIQYNLSPLINV